MNTSTSQKILWLLSICFCIPLLVSCSPGNELASNQLGSSVEAAQLDQAATPVNSMPTITPQSGESALTIVPIKATQLQSTPPATAMSSSSNSTSETVPSHLQPIVEQIIDDIFGRTQADRNAITLISHEAVTWPNGAIGCPQPGYMYTQALIEGYRLTFDANGQQMLYHTAGTDRFVFCDSNKTVPDTPVEGGTSDR